MKKYKNYRLSEKPGFDHDRIEKIREILKVYQALHPESMITNSDLFLESHFRFRIFEKSKTGNGSVNKEDESTSNFKLLFLLDDIPKMLIFAISSQVSNLTAISHFEE
jgi:hypothetical protein